MEHTSAKHSSNGQHLTLYPFYLGYSISILLCGICATIVSIEIRRHVIAGLHEAHAHAELAAVRKNLEIARQIQQSLLPQRAIPVAGYELAAWNRPADETGGDYYDWMPLNDGRCAVIIADVTGHGIGSALLMAICRSYARASMPNLDPLRAAMRQINDLLFEDVGLEHFVTFAVAILSPDHDEIELLSAGHGPTLFYHRADGVIERFSGDGLPLGVSTQEEFEEPRRIRMEEGDTLLLITDGFMEAHNGDGELFGIKRLSQSLTCHADGDINQIVSRIDTDVRAFANSHPQMDDMTAVVIRRTA